MTWLGARNGIDLEASSLRTTTVEQLRAHHETTPASPGPIWERHRDRSPTEGDGEIAVALSVGFPASLVQLYAQLDDAVLHGGTWRVRRPNETEGCGFGFASVIFADHADGRVAAAICDGDTWNVRVGHPPITRQTPIFARSVVELFRILLRGG